MPDRLKQHRKNNREASFSLLETLIALTLLATLLVEMTSVQGNAIVFSDYGRKVLQASYLAKRLMAQVEYNAINRTPIKEIAAAQKDVLFEDFKEDEFRYTLTVEPLPNAVDLMLKIASGDIMGGGDGGEKDDRDNAAAGMLKQISSLITQSVGEEPIWIAKVDVTWPEGARSNKTSVAMLLTDVKKIEESVGKFLDVAPVTNTPGVPGGSSGGPPGTPTTPTTPTTPSTPSTPSAPTTSSGGPG